MQYRMLVIEPGYRESNIASYSDRLKQSDWIEDLTLETATYADGVEKAATFKPDVVVVDGEGNRDFALMLRSQLRGSGFLDPIVLLVEVEYPGPTFVHKNRVADQLVYPRIDALLGATDMFVERSRKLRRGEKVDSILRLGDLTLDLLTGEILRGSHSVFLDVSSFELLLFMVRRPGTELSKRDLAYASNGAAADYMNDHSIVADTEIAHVKLNIEPRGTAPMIHSVGSFGYLIQAAH